MVSGETSAISAGAPDRAFPPITEIAVASMVSVVIGGIILASYLPRPAPLGFPTALLVVAAGLLLADVVMLSRLRDFAWGRFFQVVRWTLVAYAVIAGMLEYVFVVDGTRGGTLVILTLSLVIYAVDIPMILAFSVARFQEP
jgi:hypothetical protein